MSAVDYDIIVVGAGAVGLAFAAAAKQSGYSLLVLDSGPLPQVDQSRYDLRVNTINLASETFLKSVGAWDGVISKRASAFRQIRVWDSAGGRIAFSADEIGEHHLGHVIEADVLNVSLLELICQQEQTALMPEVQLESVEHDQGKALLYLADGTSVSCRLVIGADGGNSTVRTSTGIKVSQSHYGQRALVAQVEVSEPQPQTALQAFLPSGPLAFLPLADGTYSIVWSCQSALADELLGAAEAHFEQQLSKALDYRLGDSRLVSQLVSFDLRRLQVESYFANRTVLAGDAAHIIHPLAGMGVNLGLMDAAVLSEVLLGMDLADAQQGSGLYQALRKYERWRKAANTPAGFIMDGFDFGFRHPSKLVQGVLGTGLTLTNRMGFVKQEIIRLACGLSGDLPALARRV